MLSSGSEKSASKKIWTYQCVPPKEADTSSAFPQLVRPVNKKQKQSMTISAMKIREASGAPTGEQKGVRFSADMLMEGLGNLGSRFYYPREVLEAAPALFEGKKIYADHPTKEEEAIRPERSTRDVLGHWENVHVEDEDDGRAKLVGDIVFVDSDDTQWARKRMAHALEYSKKYTDQDFVGVSINAGGESEPLDIDEAISQCKFKDIKEKLEKAKNQGATEVNMVSALTEAQSCDMVTDAGAGGKVTNILEGEENVSKKNVSKVPAKVKEDGMGGADGGHDDAAADKALIAQQLKKHGLIDGGDDDQQHEGDDAPPPPKHADGDGGSASGGTGNPPHKDPGESMVNETHEMYQAYQDMGHEKEAAMTHAVEHMRLKVHQAKKEAEKKEAEGEHKEGGDAGGPPAAKAEAEKKETENEKKESDKMIAKLNGRIAMLEAQNQKTEVEKYIEKKCAESKLPHKVTKLLRESCDKAKSTKEVDERIEMFMKGFKEGQTKETFSTFHEKASFNPESKGGALDFADCAETEEA